jgi:hypothetical protein
VRVVQKAVLTVEQIRRKPALHRCSLPNSGEHLGSSICIGVRVQSLLSTRRLWAVGGRATSVSAVWNPRSVSRSDPEAACLAVGAVLATIDRDAWAKTVDCPPLEAA